MNVIGLSKRENVVRFSVSLPRALASQLDAMVEDRQLPSRSRAVAEMVRRQLARHRLALGTDVVAGTITLVYGGDRASLRGELFRIQRRYLRETLTSQHAFLEGSHSLEVLLVQGPGSRLQSLCDELLTCRGVEQAELTVTSALLPPLHPVGASTEEDASR